MGNRGGSFAAEQPGTSFTSDLVGPLHVTESEGSKRVLANVLSLAEGFRSFIQTCEFDVAEPHRPDAIRDFLEGDVLAAERFGKEK